MSEARCDESWLQLLHRAQQNDEQALTELLQAHDGYLRSGLEINPKWRGKLSKDDVMQVTYLDACLDLERFRGSTETEFRAWLHTIATNRLRDAVRGLETQKRTAPGDRRELESELRIFFAGTTPSRRVNRKEMLELLREFVPKLPEDYAEVVRLRYHEGRSSADIAAALGRSLGSVKLLQHRALRRLRDLFARDGRFSTGDT